MGTRSMNYIAVKPEFCLTPEVAKYLGAYIEISDERGNLFVFESNFSPMWARDVAGANCTIDLEEEVAIHRFLGSLPKDAFYMKRAGEECDHRGAWEQHAFRDDPQVQEIEATYHAFVADSIAESERINPEYEAMAAEVEQEPSLPPKAEILALVIGLHKALDRLLYKHDPDSIEAEWLGHSNELVVQLTGRSISALDKERQQAFEAAGGNEG